MYKYGDAWVLTALIFNKKKSSLENLIATGDLINHAIMTVDEINDALTRLIPEGYIMIDQHKRMWPTKEAFKLRTARYYVAGLFSMTDQILKQLNKHEKKVANLQPLAQQKYFSDFEDENAYRRYVDKCKYLMDLDPDDEIPGN